MKGKDKKSTLSKVDQKVPKERKKSKTGFKVTPEVLIEIKTLSGVGYSHQQLWERYDIAKDTWYNRLKNHPEMAHAYAKGKEEKFTLTVSKLWEKVQEGNLTAIIFVLKTQYRWSEKIGIDINDDRAKENEKATLRGVIDPVEASKIYQKIMAGD